MKDLLDVQDDIVTAGHLVLAALMACEAGMAAGPERSAVCAVIETARARLEIAGDDLAAIRLGYNPEIELPADTGMMDRLCAERALLDRIHSGEDFDMRMTVRGGKLALEPIVD